MVLKEKTQEAFDVIKAHGGRMTTAALAAVSHIFALI